MNAINNTLKKVTIYTDGGCQGNPGPGGYGVVLLCDNRRKELSGGYRKTTNNRMELMALIKGLEAINKPCEIEIVSDSKYLLNGIGEGWISKWKRNGWKTTAKKDVKNRDLWETLERLLQARPAKFTWVKGHSTAVENNRCDALAVQALKGGALPVDNGYEEAISKSTDIEKLL